MQKDDVLAEAAEVARLHWRHDEREATRAILGMWHLFSKAIRLYRRACVGTMLERHHVPKRLVPLLVSVCPAFLLPRFDLERFPPEPKTPPECPRSG